ncbi:MAG: hypothetical protein JW795_14350 [Chitinivibrionales bacterium]|nr:hypothetical protein [Chitinivibrionales bacterium]
MMHTGVYRGAWLLGTLVFFFSLCAEVSVTYQNLPWKFANVQEWDERNVKLTVNNTTNVPQKVEGIRFTIPNKPGTFQSDDNPAVRVVTITDGNGPNRYNSRIEGLDASGMEHLNLIRPLKPLNITLKCVGIRSNMDFSPSLTQYLIKTGSLFADKKYKNAPPITIKQLDSIVKNFKDFYNPALYVPDSLGIRGGPVSAGFIDTWFDQEKDVPVWQVQICIPKDKFIQNGIHCTFNPGIMGQESQAQGWKAGPLYAMALAMEQEYLNVDMQLMAASATNEKYAGLLKYDWDNNGQPTVPAGSAYLVEQDDTQIGPFNFILSSFNGYIYDGYRKFFPADMNRPSPYKYTTTPGLPGNGCGGNSPQIANATLISSLYYWFIYEGIFNSTEVWVEDIFARARDRSIAAKIFLNCWRYGFDNDNQSGIAILYKKPQVLTEPDVTNMMAQTEYIKLINNALLPMLAANKNSVANGGTCEIFDNEITLHDLEYFFFGMNAKPDQGELGQAGILWHYNLTKEVKIKIWNNIKAAFDILKGKAPSTQGKDAMSFRYDFLALLRVVKMDMDLNKPIPNNVEFVNFVAQHSKWDSVSIHKKKIENIYPFLVKTGKGKNGDGSFFLDVRATDETYLATDSSAAVEWTLDSNWGYWQKGKFLSGDSLSALYKVMIDAKTIADKFGDKKGIGWVRVNDRNYNSVIDSFSIENVSYPSIDSAWVSDTRGDGMAHRITVSVKKATTDGADAVAAFTQFLFAWPATTPQKPIEKSTVTINGDRLIADEGSLTSGRGEGIVILDYPSKAGVESVLLDRVGPAISSAELLESAAGVTIDTLIITLTEEIKENLQNNKEYLIINGVRVVSLSAVKNGSTIQWRFHLTSAAAKPGDRVKLYHASGLVDWKDNPPLENNQEQIIQFKGGNWPLFKESFATDTSGDGNADHVTFIIERKAVQNPVGAKQWKSLKYSWPTKSNNQEKSSPNNSVAASDDTIIVSDPTLQGGAGEGQMSVEFAYNNTSNTITNKPVADKVGPAISGSAAYLTDKKNSADPDTLAMSLSEEINSSLTSATAYCNINNTKTVSTVASYNAAKNQFLAVFASRTVKEGDSVNLVWDNGVKDLRSNPAASNNRKVPVILRQEPLLIDPDHCVYYDANADGAVDSITLGFKQQVKSQTQLDGLTFLFKWMTTTGTVKQYQVAGSLFTSQSNPSIAGAHLPDAIIDQVSQKATSFDLSNNGWGSASVTQIDPSSNIPLESPVPMKDGMAPVVASAFFAPSLSSDPNTSTQDSLLVTFSEKIQKPGVDKPLIFSDKLKGHTPYGMTLAYSSDDRSAMRFLVTGKEKEFPSTGDSVWIDQTKSVGDLFGNTQTKPNKHALLTVGKYPFSMQLLVYPNPAPLALLMKQGWNNPAAEKLCAATGNGILVIALPKGRLPQDMKLSGTLTIFDAIGNIVVNKKAMDVTTDGNTVYSLWDGTNAMKRRCGSGVYRALVSISDATSEIARQFISVGVSK